jgi:hypothetical protein
MRRVTARILLGSAVLGSVLLVSCSNGTDNSTFEPDIAKMTITLGPTCTSPGTDYSATDATNGFGGATATVTTGLFCVRSTFFRANGARESSLPSQDFVLRVSTSASTQVLSLPLAFESNGSTPLQGMLSGLDPGVPVDFWFSLYHVSQGHSDSGPYKLTITYVEPPPPGGGGGPPP